MQKCILFLSLLSVVINGGLYAMNARTNQLHQMALNEKLFEAVQSADQGKVAELIAAKANVNARESNYNRAVLEIASYGCTEIVVALINRTSANS